MNKTIIWIVIIALVIITGWLVFNKTAPTETTSPTTTETSDQSTSGAGQNTSTSGGTASMEDFTTHFACDNNMKFDVVFSKATAEKRTANVSFGNNVEQVVLVQSDSSPHIYQSGNNTLYVEGDQGNLVVNGTKYDNCHVAI